jgi:hypothetical protein
MERYYETTASSYASTYSSDSATYISPARDVGDRWSTMITSLRFRVASVYSGGSVFPVMRISIEESSDQATWVETSAKNVKIGDSAGMFVVDTHEFKLLGRKYVRVKLQNKRVYYYDDGTNYASGTVDNIEFRVTFVN